jgi:hypothetical protein
MASKTWQPIKVTFCQHAGQPVSLEAEIIYPPEILPDQAPRVVAHRCSLALVCNLDGRASCVWAGTNPAIDPFK